MERNNFTMSNNKEKHIFLKVEYDRVREELKAQMQVEMESHTLKTHIGKNLS